jgi:hypothetical protein
MPQLNDLSRSLVALDQQIAGRVRRKTTVLRPMTSARTARIRRQSREGDRWFESTSLQRRVRLSPRAAVGGREPGFPRGCARLDWRPGRQRRAGCFKIAPTGGNISVAPYSSTAEPLMGSARMPAGSNKVGAFAKLDRAVERWPWTGLNQSPARSADRARQAAGVSARGASLASDRAAVAHRGSPG